MEEGTHYRRLIVTHFHTENEPCDANSLVAGRGGSLHFLLCVFKAFAQVCVIATELLDNDLRCPKPGTDEPFRPCGSNA